jgi:uncharacterized repeat protein (TIGR01451 family)
MDNRVLSAGLTILVAAAGLTAAFAVLFHDGVPVQAGDLDKPLAQGPSGDLTVQKWSYQSLGVEPGGVVTYSILYAWDGAEDAANVRLTDTLPAEVTVLSSSPEPTSEDGQQLVYDVGTVLTASPFGTIQIVGRVSPGVSEETTITNTVRVSGDVDDTDPTNNEASVPVVVKTPEPDLWVFKWGLVEEFEYGWMAEKGTEYDFSIWYLNWGGAAASDVLLTDTLPSGVEFVSAEPSPSREVGNRLVWELDTVESFGFGEVKVTVRPTLTGTLTNIVDIATPDAEDEGGQPNHGEFAFEVVTLLPPRITHPKSPRSGGSLTVGPETRFEGLARAGAEVVLYDGPELAWSWETSTFTPILTTTAGAERFFSRTAALDNGDYTIYARAFSGTEKSEGGLWSPLHLVVSDTLPVDPEGVGIETGGQDYAPGGLGSEVGTAPGEPVTITVRLEPACVPISASLSIRNTRTGEQLPPLTPVDEVRAAGTYTYTFVFKAHAGGEYETEFAYVCGGEEERVPIVIILIDPAGYVYDVNTAGGEYTWPSKPPSDSLVVNATVTATVRTGDNTWEVWDAGAHEQYNPQVTDRTTADGVREPGYYAFFVPAGQYKVAASAPECTRYQSPILTVVDEPIYHNVGLRCTDQAATGVDYQIYLPLLVRQG